MVTLVIDSNEEESVSDKHKFQVGDDIFEEDLSKPHVQYTPNQIKHLQMKDPSLAMLSNRLQKGTQFQKPLPNTYFLNADGVLYPSVREGSKSFQAIVVLKKLYQLVLTTCHDLMGHNGTMQLYGYIRRYYFWHKLKQDCTKPCASIQRMSTSFFERTMLCRF